MTQIIFARSGSGPALLALHAFPLNAAMWDVQTVSWSKRATVWAPDYPGFGRSAEVAAFTSLDDLARRLLEHLRTEGVRRAAVVGCSIGGYLAFALLRVAPEFVSSLVVIDSKATADTDVARANRRALAERVEREGCAFLADEWHLGALSPVTLAQRPAVVERVRALVRQATPAGVAAAQRAMAARPDSTPLLSQLDIPNLVIQGLDDPYISEAEARSMAAQMKSVRFVTVPEAGHLPNLERPEIVTQAVEDFLASGIGGAGK
jgi:pimeloyl-ACP methyl ester carboxylesterase